MCRSGLTRWCIFRQVVAFCFILAVSAASETKSEDSKLAVEQQVGRTHQHHHHQPQARSDWASWANGLGPATLITIGAIIIIFFIMFLVLECKLKLNLKFVRFIHLKFCSFQPFSLHRPLEKCPLIITIRKWIRTIRTDGTGFTKGSLGS